MLSRFRLTALAVTVLAVATAAPAQCGFQWRPGPPTNGPDGDVAALLELPNGDLIAGGAFTIADGAIVNGVARWDGSGWHPIGGGFAGPGQVSALARLPNGDLVAGGSFTMAGGVAAANIARWNGSSWQPLGTGLDRYVNALQVLPNGDLVAAGWFRFAGGANVRSLARWDGVSWNAMDNSVGVFEAYDLALLPNGDLIAGIDDLQGLGAVRWTGTTWQALPGLSGSFNEARHLAVMPNGFLALSGTLFIGGAIRRLAVFDGTGMTPNDPPVNPQALLATDNGDLVVAGNVAGGSSVLRYDGTAWQVQAGGPYAVQTLLEDANGRLVAGGRIDDAAGIGAVMRLVGQTWSTLGAGTPPEVVAAVRLANGDVVVGGRFDALQGAPVQNLARWNGTTWVPVGGGVDGRVTCLAAAPNGDLVVGGEFTNAGGAPANFVARWNGQTWSTLGAGLPGAPTQIGAGANGRVLAVVTGVVPIGPGVHEFSGGTWAQTPLAFTNAFVRRIVALPSGGFALVGLFGGVPGQQIGALVYDNGVTTPLPSVGAIALDALVDRGGDLVAIYGGVRRWDGTAWTQLSPASPLYLAELPDGTLVGAFSPSSTSSSLRRITATGAEAFGDVRGTLTAIAASSRGDIVLGGDIEMVGNQVSAGFAQAQPICASAVTTFGAGCTGSAGPVTLAAENTPWTGAPFTMVASGMTANSLAVQIVGVQPLSVPLPGGAPGCSVFVDAMFVEAFVPSGGAVTTTWLVPDTAAAVGLTVRAQVVGVELSAVGIDRLTSSNALRAVIGSL